MIDINLLFEYVKTGEFTVEKHTTEDLYIFGYATGPVTMNKKIHWNNVNKKMRGLIVDSKGNIKARSFEKFFTFKEYLSSDTILLNDSQIMKLVSKKFKVFEKLDGSLSILYWINDIPYMATQRSFTSLKAKKATEILHKNYKHLFSKLKKDRTYIFEAIYPESSVLINYGNDEKLVLLGVLENKTGKDLGIENIGFPIAKDWTDEFSEIQNLSKLESLNLRHIEGFVVCFDNNQRVKVKFPWYKKVHSDLNKLIFLELKKLHLQNQLKKELNIPKNIINTKMLWKRFKKGDKPKEILNDFPDIYTIVGVEDWLKKEYSKFNQKLKKESNQSKISPDKVINFDFSKLIHQPNNELIMWKRVMNLKKNYD